jgi:hypothetical protein
MSALDDKLMIRKGGNSWRILRTDRDDADRDSVLQGAGQVLCHWLNLPSPTGYRGIFQILHMSANGARLVVAAARPMLITVERSDGAKVMHDRELGISAIDRAVLVRERAWAIRADFDWQGHDQKIAWPYQCAAVLGSSSLNDAALDWLLIGASAPPPMKVHP